MEEERDGTIGNLKGRKGEAREIYERYGHISCDTLKNLPNFPKIDKQYPRCEACEKGTTRKPQAKPQGKNTIRISRRLERHHADLVGPNPP